MKNLLLITQGFPYGESEQSFLREEFTQLSKEFNITILALDHGEEILYPIEDVAFTSLKCAYPIPDRKKDKFVFYLKNILVNKIIIQDICKACKKTDAKIALKRVKSILWYSAVSKYFLNIINEIVADNKIDIVYSYWCTESTIASLLLKKKFSNLKVITRFHGFDLYNERIVGSYWQPLRSFVSEQTDKLIFACEKGKAYFNERWPNEKSIVSYLGTKEYSEILTQTKHAELTIASCSNAILLKRIELIVEALSLLPPDIKVTWHHIGDGEELENLKNKSKFLLEEKTNIKYKFHGYVKNQDLESLYNNIKPDIFITTTSTEGGAPVSIQEAFAMGIPAIGTDVGGIAEIINDNVNGFLLSENPSAGEIKEKIIEFYSMPADQKKIFSDNARDTWQEKFDAISNAKRIKDLLSSIK